MGAFSFFTTAELRGRGMTPRDLRAAIDVQQFEPVIRGWFATPQADRDAVAVLRAGARLGCVSALELHGAWCPPVDGPHVVLPSHASGRRLHSEGLPSGAVTHWAPKKRVSGSSFAVAPIALAVEQLLVCQPPHLVVAVLDSLLYRRLVSRNRLEALLAHGPAVTRTLADHLEPKSEEGIESIVRFGLASVGIRCRVQVVLRKGTRVDLLIDDWLILEIEGRETHALMETFTKDRVRAAHLMRDGRIVLQFAYASVVHDLDFVLDTVAEVIEQHAPVGR